MSEHFYGRKDFRFVREMKAAPEEFAAWAAFDKVVGRSDGAIPQKYRELMAVAVAHATQCAWCIDAHTRLAKKAGASKQEIAEAVLIAAALQAGAAVMHGTVAMQAFDDAAAQP